MAQTNPIPQINRDQIREEFENKQFLTIQGSLYKERNKRMFIMGMLLSALIFTIIFGTLQNPFQYTFMHFIWISYLHRRSVKILKSQ